VSNINKKKVFLNFSNPGFATESTNIRVFPDKKNRASPDLSNFKDAYYIEQYFIYIRRKTFADERKGAMKETKVFYRFQVLIRVKNLRRSRMLL
jgi:hypothetical protein